MAGAYQPRSLWEKRLAPTVLAVGLWRDRLWHLEAGQLCPPPPPGSCQAVWFLPSVGDRNYVVASHILWYVCLMASLCGSKSSTVLSCDPEGLLPVSVGLCHIPVPEYEHCSRWKSAQLRSCSDLLFPVPCVGG